jgi:hypothetical protein
MVRLGTLYGSFENHITSRIIANEQNGSLASKGTSRLAIGALGTRGLVKWTSGRTGSWVRI